MYIGINPNWIKTCGRRQGLAVDGLGNHLFKVIRVDDFGSRGKMYKVEVPYGDWTVWDLRGIVEYSDEEIAVWLQ